MVIVNGLSILLLCFVSVKYLLYSSCPLVSVIGKRSGCMLSSPRLEFIEKVRGTAAKKLEMASKALLNARETDEGPIFNDDQNVNMAAICK